MDTTVIEMVIGMPALKAITEMRMKAQKKRDSLGILCVREGGKHT